MASKRDWPQAREKIRGEKCRVCHNENVDPAHLIPRSRVGPGIGENKDNIVPLCRYHHTRFDNGQFDLLPYLTRSEQATAVFLGGLEYAYRRLTGGA